VIPPAAISKHFVKFAAPIFSKIKSNLDQSRTLATLHVTLLPKLLSGELEMNLKSL
jgi:hypothetical protein